MNEKALEFLKEHRICVLGVELQDGQPHSATVHYAQTEKPLRLYVLTERSSRKCSGLLEGAHKRASFVTGFIEGGATLQFEGTVRMIGEGEGFEAAKELYLAKLPSKDNGKFFANPEAVFLEFTPSWWQFSDYSQKDVLRTSGSL